MRARARVKVRVRARVRVRVRVKVRVRVSDVGHQRLHPIVAAGVVEMVVRRQHLS